MSVLVGIVTRNRAAIVTRAIASVMAQQGNPVRLAVIDDASSDETTTMSARFPQATWTRWQASRGYLAARTELMGRATEDYYVSLDDDAWFLQGDEIARAVQVLEQKPSVAAVAFDILSPDRPAPVPRGDARETAMFIGCGHVLRLSAVRAVGAYVPAPGRYGGEEKDLCLRLMDAGYQIVTLPGVHVWHEKSSLARAIPEQHESGVCNDLTLALRRTPIFLLPLALTMKCYKHAAFSWRHGLTRPCIRGLLLVVRSFAAVWRLRQPVKPSTLRAFVRLSSATR